MSRVSRDRVGAAIEQCYIDLGRWLRDERIKFGLSQQDVSVMLRLSRPSIANIEAGKQRLMHHVVLEMRERITEAGALEYLSQVRTLEDEERILAQAEQIRLARLARKEPRP